MTSNRQMSRRRIMMQMAALVAAPMILRPASAQPVPGGEAARALGPLLLDAPDPIRRGPRSRPLIAMSFDDGPHHQLTPLLLDILAARRIRASFFVLGNRAVHRPEILARMVRDGHEIGNHSWSHPRLKGLTDAALLAQIDQTSGCIMDATGRRPVVFRPPYGAISAHQRRLIHAERGLPTVLWSVDPQDWRRPGAQVVTRRILDQVHPGAIVLSHDIVESTVAAMPAVLDGLIARGYAFGTVSELIAAQAWDGA